MPIEVCNQGEELMLDLVLAVNYTLRLYKTTDVTNGLTRAQINALTEASFTEATFTGYAAKALTGGSWVSTQANPSTGTYAQQTFTSSANQAAQTIYGYYICRTSDNKLMWHERFTGPLIVSLLNDTIQVTPTLTLEDDEDATVTARGIIAKQRLTSDSAGYTTDGTSDFALANVTVDSTRTYAIKLQSPFGINNIGRWLVYVYADGVNLDRIGDVVNLVATTKDGMISGEIIWEPATGTVNLDIRIDEISGTTTLTFPASAAATRTFWVEDIGARI